MSPKQLTVLFDGGCPLCSREIEHYRKLPSLIPIRWLDIAADGSVCAQWGIDRRTALEVFHVLDDSGRFHLGADGFVTLWRALPYYRWLARLCASLHLLPAMRWGYRHFARWHFRKRCAEGVCG